jgi:class 3 adenylate cyclase
VDVPSTRYARSGDLQIAYQALGAGPLDVVFVPVFSSCIEAVWALPGAADLLRRVASFSRLLLFDRRGSGMSDGQPGVASLEEQVDDVLAVLDAAGFEHAALISVAEGCALATVFAASHPRAVRSLVMITPVPRTLRGPGYEWAPSQEDRAQRVRVILDHWGSESPDNPLMRFMGADSDRGRQAIARLQRLSMSPGAAAAAQRLVTEIDVRHLLPSIQCPTLVLRRSGDAVFDERHSRYAADHIPGARYVELPGDGPVWRGDDVDAAVHEIEHFLTGTHQPVVSDRVLATVLFTDIVGSTDKAAQLGDSTWRSLLKRHDDLVRAEIERHRGRFVKSLGDGVLATFDGPSRAISSALEIRDRVHDLGLDIRAGLHAGECELLDEDDVGGMAVHIGARISRLAQPGEVLVTSTVRDLIVGSGLTLSDRGEHELKGVPGPWRTYAVET